MTEVPMIRVLAQRGEGDCTIATLAMLCGVSYEDALEAATGRAAKAHRRGMWGTDIIATAAKLGTVLCMKRRWDYETATGILYGSVMDRISASDLKSKKRRVGHVVLLRWGLIIEPDGGELWEPDDYVRHKQAEFTKIFSREAK